MKRILTAFITALLTGICCWAYELNGTAEIMVGSNTTIYVSSDYKIMGAPVAYYSWRSAYPSHVEVGGNYAHRATIIGHLPINKCPVYYDITFYSGANRITLEYYYEVTVLPKPITSIELSAHEITVEQGCTAPLKATIMPANTTTFSFQWVSTDTEIAKVGSFGTVTAVQPGIATVICQAIDGTGIADSCTVTVIPRRVSSITLCESEIKLRPNETFRLEADIAPDDAACTDVEWWSDDADIAQVDGSGTVTAVAPGATTVRCFALDGSGIEASCTVVVKDIHDLEIVLPKGVVALRDPEGQSIIIRPDSDCKLHSVRLGEDDVTADLVDGTYTIPPLEANTTLRAIFEVISEQNPEPDSDVQILIDGCSISLKGAPAGFTAILTDASGTILLTTDQPNFEAPASGSYILTIDSRTFKFAI